MSAFMAFVAGTGFGIVLATLAAMIGEWRVRRDRARRGGDISEAIRGARR